MRRVFTCMLGTLAVALSLLAVYGQPPADAKPAAAQPDIQAFLQKYVEVFNKHDAKMLAEFWAPQAVSSDTATGERIVGREAIQADFEAAFKDNPKSRLTVRLKNHRFIKPEILSISGELTVTGSGDDDSNTVNFTALLMKQGDKWLIEEATESPLATPATPFDGLKDLAWLVGSWKDDVEGLNVTSEIKWSESKSFLLRKYTIENTEDNSTESGTQIIAWDPRSKTIRSWTFCADGTFGEGVWSQSGQEWRVKFTHTNADGSLLSGTQLLNKTEADTVTVQIVGQEEDGEPQPNGPVVKMVRQTPVSK